MANISPGTAIPQNAELARLVLDLIIEKFSWLITLVQAIGVFLFMYLLYLFFRIYLDAKNRGRVKEIKDEITSISMRLEKIEKMLKSKKKKAKTNKKKPSDK